MADLRVPVRTHHEELDVLASDRFGDDGFGLAREGVACDFKTGRP